MPKRSNPFQRLVYHLHRQLAPDAVVVESEELVDRVTEDKMEVDVVVHAEAGGYPVIISVECTRGRRRATLGWVNEMIKKHARLPTNKLVLVTRAGFTKRAKHEAELNGVETYTLNQALQVDWTQIVGRLKHLYMYPVTITPLSVEVFIETDGGAAPHSLSPDEKVYSREGSLIGAARQIVHSALRDPRLMRQVHEQVPREGEKSGECGFTWIPGSYANDVNGQPHVLTRFRVRFSAKRGAATPIELTTAGWRGMQLGYGSAATSLGQAFVSIMEQEGRELTGYMTLIDENTGEERTGELHPFRDSEKPSAERDDSSAGGLTRTRRSLS